MSIIIEPQILDVAAVKPINVEIKKNGSNEVKVSTVKSSTVGIGAAAFSNNYNGLSHKPQINGVTLEDNKTSEDLHIKEDLNYLHTQTVASDTWVILHNLNKFPSVTVIDSAGNEIVGDVIYDDVNQVTLKFKGGFKGTATLN